MNVNKAVTYTISVDEEEYNALVYMAGVMIKVVEQSDDSKLYMDLGIDIDTIEEKQDILYQVAETISFSH
jgi:hypothetical protein